MQVSYPNESDRILGERKPGSEIMIHGKCLSIGCLAMQVDPSGGYSFR
jgi:murein L,D-transpeptidase YafK